MGHRISDLSRRHREQRRPPAGHCRDRRTHRSNRVGEHPATNIGTRWSPYTATRLAATRTSWMRSGTSPPRHRTLTWWSAGPTYVDLRWAAARAVTGGGLVNSCTTSTRPRTGRAPTPITVSAITSRIDGLTLSDLINAYVVAVNDTGPDTPAMDEASWWRTAPRLSR